MNTPRSSRFVSIDADGETIALVAEGVPPYPEDGNLTGLSDADLGAIHTELLARIQDVLSADTETTATNAELRTMADQVTALRTEAAARFAAAAPADPPAATDPPADPPAPDPALSTETPDADLLAEVQGLIDEPAATDPLASISTDPADPHVTHVTVHGASADATAAAVTAALAEPLSKIGEALERVAVRSEPQPRFPLSAYGQPERTQANPDAPDASGGYALVAAADLKDHPMGSEFADVSDLAKAMAHRWDNLGKVGEGIYEEKVVIGSVSMADRLPEERNLRGVVDNPQSAWSRIRKVISPGAPGVDPWTGKEKPVGRGGIIVADPDALVASGGLAAPVEPYYPQANFAIDIRPVLDSLPAFTAERGGIKLVLPATILTLKSATVTGQFTDGVSNNSTTFTSATADFTNSDLYQPIVETDAGGYIPAGTIITAIGSSTSVTVSATVTGSHTGIQFRLPSRNPNNLGPAVGLVTAAQDAAGSPQVTKFTYDVPIGTQAEFDVHSIYTSLQFANLTSRTFPEQVELNILLAAAVAAFTADQALLDNMTNYSTLLTGAKTFGTARQLLAQLEHMASFYRNSLRMDPMAVLRVFLPAWAINAMRSDWVSTFTGSGIGDSGLGGLSDQELMSWFQERALLPSFYLDSPSDVAQLFTTSGISAATNTGSNTATPMAIPDYPGSGSGTAFRTSVVSYMFAEGTWLGLTTGDLNVGLVRDSILNSQNRFRNFQETWEAAAFVGALSLRCVHTVAADGTYGAAAAITLGAGSGL